MTPRRWAAVGALIVAAILLGNRGFRRMATNYREVRRLRRELTVLKTEETTLTSQIHEARKNDSTLETAARHELGYIKPGEVEYRFPPPTAGK